MQHHDFCPFPGHVHRPPAKVMTRLEPGSAAVMNDSTLKEALSKMVQQGIRSAPVVNSKGVLEGEIRLEDILEA